MKLEIDPKIDCVFKYLLGKEDNRSILLDFTNAIVTQAGQSELSSIQRVQDKETSLEIEAQAEEVPLLVEIQMDTLGCLPQEILYSWAKLYHRQLPEGEKHSLLKKTILIYWSHHHNALPTPDYFNVYQWKNSQGQIFCDDVVLVTIELPKFAKEAEHLESACDAWIYFFKQGQDLDLENLPSLLQGDIFREACKVVRRFSEKDLQPLYAERQRSTRVLCHKLEEKFERGKAAGMALGERQAREAMAKSLLTTGTLTLQKIAQITGFSKEEVEKFMLP